MLAEFCSCGSIMISGRCTNKNCDMRHEQKPGTPVKASASRKATATSKTDAKPAKTRRASKCITYNIKDLQKDEENT